jgi:hypothetical protein
MKIANDDLKKLYQRYVTSKIPDNRNKCPSPMALSISFESLTSIRNKKEIIDHITECSFCREEFEILLDLQKCQASFSTSISGNSSTDSTKYILGAANSAKRIIWRYAYFLIGLVLILTAYYLIIQRNSFSEAMRTSEQRILLFAPAQVHTFPKPLIFRWEAQPSSQYYILELFDNSLLPIWTSQKLVDIQTQLPVEVLSSLQSGNYYFWMITAFSSTQKISESELLRFLVLNK